MPDLPSPDPGEEVLNAIEVHGWVMHAAAKYAGVRPDQLRGVLLRLADQPDVAWPGGSAEERAERFIALAGLPDLLTLIDDWTAPLDFLLYEVDALVDGVPLAVVLATLSLPDCEGREEVLIEAWDESWDAAQTEMAVRAMWDTLEVPAGLLAAMDGFRAALSNPALVHGSARYASLRRALFESELGCRQFVQEQTRKYWEQRKLEDLEGGD